MNLLNKLGSYRQDNDKFLKNVLKAKNKIDTVCHNNIDSWNSNIEQNVFHIEVQENTNNNSFSSSSLSNDGLDSISSVSEYHSNDLINQSFDLDKQSVNGDCDNVRHEMFDECSFNIRDRRKSEINLNLGNYKQLLIEKKKASLNK